MLPQQFKAGYGGITPVLKFHLALDGAVVAANHLAEQVGVTAAAEVFEKKGLVEAGELVVREAKFRGDPHAEQAGADGVAGAGVFGEVKGKREGRDDIR